MALSFAGLCDRLWRWLAPPEEAGPPLAASRSREEDLDALLLLVQEAVYRMGDVEELLCAIRDDEPLAELAPRGAPVVSRFLAMRMELRAIESPDLRRLCRELGEEFQYLAYVLHYALDLLAVSWRSERLREEQQMMGSLGAGGERLLRLADEVEDLAIEASFH